MHTDRDTSIFVLCVVHINSEAWKNGFYRQTVISNLNSNIAVCLNNDGKGTTTSQRAPCERTKVICLLRHINTSCVRMCVWFRWRELICNNEHEYDLSVTWHAFFSPFLICCSEWMTLKYKIMHNIWPKMTVKKCGINKLTEMVWKQKNDCTDSSLWSW